MDSVRARGRVLLTWELGGNLGHVVPLLALAKGLRERGLEVVFAIREIRGAARLIKAEGFTVLQAPVARSRLAQLKNPASYPEILLLNGFADPESLIAATHAWRDLFRLVSPDSIVFDSSPTALLAAHGTGIPRILFGTGFSSPPRISPMPSIRPWQSIPIQRLQVSEQRALDCANAALRAVGARPIEALYEPFQVEEDILATFPELDHYGARKGTRYWGPIFDAGGEPPRWPEGEGKKVFVYLRPDSSAFRPLAATLKKTQTRTLWFAPGVPASTIDTLSTESVRFTSKPLSISAVASTADIACLHSGHGTTAAMLFAGVPMLCFPEHVEQLLVARNVVSLGAGAVVTSRASPSDMAQLLTRLTENNWVAEQLRNFAHRHNEFDQRKTLLEMVAGIEALNVSGKLANEQDGPTFLDDLRARNSFRKECA